MTLKELRLSSNLTQAALAKRLDVSIRTIAAYESGERRPSIKVAEKIGNMFYLTTDEIWRLFYSQREG